MQHIVRNRRVYLCLSTVEFLAGLGPTGWVRSGVRACFLIAPDIPSSRSGTPSSRVRSRHRCRRTNLAATEATAATHQPDTDTNCAEHSPWQEACNWYQNLSQARWSTCKATVLRRMCFLNAVCMAKQHMCEHVSFSSRFHRKRHGGATSTRRGHACDSEPMFFFFSCASAVHVRGQSWVDGCLLCNTRGY